MYDVEAIHESPLQSGDMWASFCPAIRGRNMLRPYTAVFVSFVSFVVQKTRSREQGVNLAEPVSRQEIHH
jgi:hypothetical protein